MDELLEAKRRYKNLKYIDFQDDVFTTSKEWLQEFLPRYKAEIGLPFQCLTHPKYMDDDIARWLKDAGCLWVQLGVQSMDEEFKNKIKRFERSDHIKLALGFMKGYRLLQMRSSLCEVPHAELGRTQLHVSTEQQKRIVQTLGQRQALL